MLQLRDYQEAAVQTIVAELSQENSALLTAATGAGKTIILSAIIAYYKRKYPRMRFLIVVHQQNLVEQNYNKFVYFFPEYKDKTTIACNSCGKVDFSGDIVFGSRQTVSNRLSSINKFSLLIIDEVHHLGTKRNQKSQYKNILDKCKKENPTIKLIGVTATPYTMYDIIYGKDKDYYFTKIAFKISIKELQKKGFLCNYEVKKVIYDNFLEKLETIGEYNGDYKTNELSSFMSKEVNISNVIKTYQKEATEKKHTVIFCVTIEHAELVKDDFMKKGITSEIISYKQDKKIQNEIMEKFESGEIKVLCSVTKLTEGWDMPETDCLIMARPTKSVVLYIQMIGRGLRLKKDNGKLLLIDMVGNYDIFGDPDTPNIISGKHSINRETQIECPRCTNVIGKDVETCPKCGELIKYKICPGCEIKIKRSQHECPQCGFIFEDIPLQENLSEIIAIKNVYNSEENFVDPTVFTLKKVTFMFHYSKKGNKCLKIMYEGYSGCTNCVYQYYDIENNYSYTSFNEFKKLCKKFNDWYEYIDFNSLSMDNIFDKEFLLHFKFPEELYLGQTKGDKKSFWYWDINDKRYTKNTKNNIKIEVEQF